MCISLLHQQSWRPGLSSLFLTVQRARSFVLEWPLIHMAQSPGQQHQSGGSIPSRTLLLPDSTASSPLLTRPFLTAIIASLDTQHDWRSLLVVPKLSLCGTSSVRWAIQKNLSEAQLSDYATTVVLKSGVWVNLPHCCLRDNDRKDFEPEEVWHNTASEFAPLYIQFYVTSPSPVYAGSVRVEMQSVVTLNYRPEDSLLHTATHVGNKQIPTP